MIDEKNIELINNVVNDVNWLSYEFVDYFDVQLKLTKYTVTKNTVKKIHKKFKELYFKKHNFESSVIKSKDAKYYLIRGWMSSDIVVKFNLPVYDYRPIEHIVSDDDLVLMYCEMSLNEISLTLNINYARLKKYINDKKLVSLRSLRESTGTDRVISKRKQTSFKKYGVENPSSVAEFKEKRKHTVLEKYGVDNVFKSEEIKDKITETFFRKYGKRRFTQTEDYLHKVREISEEKYGVTHFSQNEDVKKNIRLANLSRYGCEYSLQNAEVRTKINQTMISLYGVKNPSNFPAFRRKAEKTMLRRYGKHHYSQTDECKEKSKETSLKKYGFEYPMQNSELFVRTVFRRKKVITPSGLELFLQGYEPIVYVELLKYFDELEIITDNTKMPKILYNYKRKKKRYFPDIFLPLINLVIEVKSMYTYQVDIEKNELKRQAVVDSGIDFEFIILEEDRIDESTSRRIRDIGNNRN